MWLISFRLGLHWAYTCGLGGACAVHPLLRCAIGHRAVGPRAARGVFPGAEPTPTQGSGQVHRLHCVSGRLHGYPFFDLTAAQLPWPMALPRAEGLVHELAAPPKSTPQEPHSLSFPPATLQSTRR